VVNNPGDQAPISVSTGAPKSQESGKLRRIARTVARLFRVNHLDYDDTRYVFRLARAAAGLTRGKRPHRLPDYLPLEEVERLIAAAYRQHPSYGLLAEVLFWSGIRVSEAAGLRVENLILAENQAKVVAGKGAKDRFVFLPESVCEKLRLHVHGREEGPVFLSRLRRALSVRRIEQIIRKAARAAGLERKKVTPHALRRSIGTYLLNNGVPLDAVADLLGHADLKVTRDHYARMALPTLKSHYFQAVRAPTQPGEHRA
jgi:site-specific recombinase XerD